MKNPDEVKYEDDDVCIIKGISTLHNFFTSYLGSCLWSYIGTLGDVFLYIVDGQVSIGDQG
jgi:hypothetical protein